MLAPTIGRRTRQRRIGPGRPKSGTFPIVTAGRRLYDPAALNAATRPFELWTCSTVRRVRRFRNKWSGRKHGSEEEGRGGQGGWRGSDHLEVAHEGGGEEVQRRQRVLRRTRQAG